MILTHRPDPFSAVRLVMDRRLLRLADEMQAAPGGDRSNQLGGALTLEDLGCAQPGEPGNFLG